ncbi:MAG TPA: hypothetical protein VKO83_08455 [Steroidobacteraceae bacterium]|nr:hypothetical protein [Steroidobacteraceae bacterium]
MHISPRHSSAQQPASGASRLSSARLARLKRSYVTRRVPLDGQLLLDSAVDALLPGDLVIARVTRIGQHRRVELPTGRKSELFIDDELLLACGARYAADQFEAYAARRCGIASLVAAGGIAGVVASRHALVKPATGIEIVGALRGTQGEILNVRQFALPNRDLPASTRAPVLVVAGAAMNSGKTTTAASIVHGLTRGGLRVAACKVTGTGAGGDPGLYVDAGATEVLDFTDAGHATTAGLTLPELERVAGSLLSVADATADVIVVEIADGLLQTETAALLQAPRFRSLVSGVIFAAGDAMAAVCGVRLLRQWNYEPVAVSGLLTTSPLAMHEAQSTLSVPVVDADFLRRDDRAAHLLLRATAQAADAAHVA